MNENEKMLILVDQLTPRVEYVMEVIFTRVLGISFEIQTGETGFSNRVLDYRTQSRPDTPSVPVAGLLYETHIRSEVPELGTHQEIPILFPARTSDTFPFDLFSATFYLLTEYYHQAHPSKDPHGRYREQETPLYKAGLHDRPVVNLWAAQLWEWLKTAYPDLEQSPPTFDYEITVDIDNPWKYLYKPFWVNWAASFKDLLKRNTARRKERKAVLDSGKDPFDTYQEIRRICPPEKTRYFFLIDRTTSFDSWYTYTNHAYQQLIRILCQPEYCKEAGLHPSYFTSRSRLQLEIEVEEMSALLGHPPRITRQHFLRYRYPDTFKWLEANGFEADYSLCPISYVGFRTGLAGGHYWFDLEENRISTLWLMPAAVMDRGLQQYLGLSPEAALEKIDEVIQEIRAVNGTFVIILHNETFSENGEWKGWKSVIEGMMHTLKKD